MDSVESSWIAGIEHDPATNTLTVHMKNGEVYDYQKCDRATYNAFPAAPSASTYFRAVVAIKQGAKRLPAKDTPK